MYYLIYFSYVVSWTEGWFDPSCGEGEVEDHEDKLTDTVMFWSVKFPTGKQIRFNILGHILGWEDMGGKKLKKHNKKITEIKILAISLMSQDEKERLCDSSMEIDSSNFKDNLSAVKSRPRTMKCGLAIQSVRGEK